MCPSGTVCTRINQGPRKEPWGQPQIRGATEEEESEKSWFQVTSLWAPLLELMVDQMWLLEMNDYDCNYLNQINKN